MSFRLNKCFLFIGRKGTGKTTLARDMATKIQNANGRKIIIIDTDDHPSYADVPVITLEQLKKWSGLICRIIESDIDQVFSILNNYQSNAVVICEDASKYVTANITKALRTFIIDMRKRNFDLIFMFHFLSDVPPYLCKQYDTMVLFKTGDNLQVKQNKFANWHTIVGKLKRILKTEHTIIAKQSASMSKEEYKAYLLSNTRTKLALLYGVDIATFNGWIDLNPILKNAFLPYLDTKKSKLPPSLIILVIDTLGEP